MKFNFKKITSVLAGALMLGSTIGFAAAANYPAPFVQGGTANVGIVVGAGAANSDYVAAVSVGTDLQAELAKQTLQPGPSTPVISGEGVSLSTSSRSLYYGDSINAGRTTLTSSELPSVLADGTFTDLTGTSYTYQQSLVLGGTKTVFGTSGGDLNDPKLYLDVGTDANAPLYNYTLSFNKNLNVSDASNVQGQKISILGVDYIVGAGSTNSTLVLYGSGDTKVINSQDGPQTVPIGDVDHIIELVTTTSATTAKISVDGSSRTVTKGNAYTFSGGVVIYVKDVTHPTYQGDMRSVELILGANSLRLENGNAVKYGSELTSIKGTKATITAADNGVISGFTVQVAMAKSKVDHLAAGDSFVDPVFGGLQVQFVGENPALDSTARGAVTVDTDNQQFGYVSFDSARAAGTETPRLAFVYDNNTASTAVQPLLAHQQLTSADKGHIIVAEGQNAKEDDWVVINQGDAGTIAEVSEINVDPDQATGTVTLTDAITGSSYEATLSNTTGGFTKQVSMFGGTGYTIWANRAGTAINITWDGTTATTLFPRVKLRDGGWLAFLTDTTVANGTQVILPEGGSTIDSAGVSAGVSNATGTLVANGINWTTKENNGGVDIYGIVNCNFNSTRGPAVLFLEPKKWDDGTRGNYVCIPLTTTGTTEIAIGDPVTDATNSGFIALNSDSTVKQLVDKFGTFVTKTDKTNENGKAVLSYPKSQMTVDVLFTAKGATASSGSSGGGSVTEIGSLVKEDSEISAVQDRNLIVIGGSCINSIAAKILGVPEHTCSTDFTTKTGIGPDQFLIKVVNSPYTAGRIAMLVAGYEAADTTKAVEYLKVEKPATTNSTELKKVTATYANVA